MIYELKILYEAEGPAKYPISNILEKENKF